MINLPYGKTFLGLDTNNINGKVKIIEPNDTPAISDPDDHVMYSINFGLKQATKIRWEIARSVAIAINDKTRPVPYHVLLPPLLQKINELSYKRISIHLIVSTGTHSVMGREEMQLLIPFHIPDNCVIESHDCDDRSNLEFLGQTSRGTPVWINSRFLRSDIKIVTGNIEPHHFMGFSGGAKTAAIGLAGRETINHNHAMITDPKAILGEYKSNPMRMDVEEIGSMINIDFALNTILNSNKQIVTSLFGSPAEVMTKGIQLIEDSAEYRSDKYFDVVIASAGGHPKDINLYQAQKALTHSSRLVKQGGYIILVAACPEGSGSQSFEDYVQRTPTIMEVINKFKSDGFRVGPHKALQIAIIAKQCNIILVSELPPTQVKRFFMTPSGSLEESLTMALGDYGEDAEIAILPHATNIIPRIQPT